MDLARSDDSLFIRVVSQHFGARYHHFLGLHFFHGVRDATDTLARVANAGKRHPVDTEQRVFIVHHWRGVELLTALHGGVQGAGEDCSLEAGVGIGIIPQSEALRHHKTMQLSVVPLDEPWALRERGILVRDFDALPGCVKALINLMRPIAGDSRKLPG